MKWCLILTIFAISGAQGQESEFRRQLEILNERYEDFFAHEQRLRRYEEMIKKGVPQHKHLREEEQRLREKVRREQVANRREEPDTTELEREHERKKAEQEKVHDRYRREYIQYREQLEKIASSARKIPENRDAGLE